MPDVVDDARGPARSQESRKTRPTVTARTIRLGPAAARRQEERRVMLAALSALRLSRLAADHPDVRLATACLEHWLAGHGIHWVTTGQKGRPQK